MIRREKPSGNRSACLSSVTVTRPAGHEVPPSWPASHYFALDGDSNLNEAVHCDYVQTANRTILSEQQPQTIAGWAPTLVSPVYRQGLLIRLLGARWRQLPVPALLLRLAVVAVTTDHSRPADEMLASDRRSNSNLPYLALGIENGGPKRATAMSCRSRTVMPSLTLAPTVSGTALRRADEEVAAHGQYATGVADPRTKSFKRMPNRRHVGITILPWRCGWATRLWTPLCWAYTLSDAAQFLPGTD